MDGLTFLEGDAGDGALDAALDVDRVVGRDGP